MVTSKQLFDFFSFQDPSLFQSRNFLQGFIIHRSYCYASVSNLKKVSSFIDDFFYLHTYVVKKQCYNHRKVELQAKNIVQKWALRK